MNQQRSNYALREQALMNSLLETRGRRARREMADEQKIEKAIRETIVPMINALEGDPLLVELFAVLEMHATKTNAGRIANHRLRPDGVEAAKEGRIAGNRSVRCAEHSGAGASRNEAAPASERAN